MLFRSTASSLPPTVTYAYRTRSDYLQTTEFANLSYDLTDRLNVEAGVVHFAAHSRYESRYGQFAWAPESPSLTVSDSSKVTSKVGVNYKAAEHLLLYADFGQGFRDGGSNSGLPDLCYRNGTPAKYVPDTLNNYELGWKSTLMNGRMVFNGAAYWMDWKDLQTTIYDVDICATSSFNANVGKARIYGVESNVDLRLDEHWSSQLALSYTDSHLASTTYPTFRPNVGERLPFVPYFSYSWKIGRAHV